MMLAMMMLYGKNHPEDFEKGRRALVVDDEVIPQAQGRYPQTTSPRPQISLQSDPVFYISPSWTEFGLFLRIQGIS